jgi:hypothetical protein
MSYGDRFDQSKVSERHGAGVKAQSSDATGTTDDLAGFLTDGTLTAAGLQISDVLTLSGAGAGAGLTAGDWYGQVPRGTVDGSNTHFLLDYIPRSPITILIVDGEPQLPGVQGDGAGNWVVVPGGEYQVSTVDNTLTVQHPPRGKFYIWYLRGEPIEPATHVALTVTTAFTSDPALSGQGAVSIYTYDLPVFGQLPQKASNTSWAKTTDTFDVTSTLLPVQLTQEAGRQALHVYFFSDFGNRFATYSPGDILDIYDCFLTVTWADGSTTIYRPTAWDFIVNSNLAHMVEDPPNSSNAYGIDSDANTYARYNRTVGGSNLSTTSAYKLYGFAPYSSTPAPTPVPLPTGDPINLSSGGTTSLTPTDSGSAVIISGSGASTITLPSAIAAPSAPTLTQTAGGTLSATTYYAKITLTNASGETIASAESTLAVSANHLLGLTSPGTVAGATGYNVYVGTTSGAETKQNTSAIPIGTNWTQPTSGLVSGGPLVPVGNTASPDESFTSTIVNGGTGTITVQAPSGTSLNGTTSGTVTVPAGATAIVYFNPDTNNYTVAVTGGSSTASPATPLLGSDGTPLVDPASGEWIFNA